MKECLFCGMRCNDNARTCKACGTPFITEHSAYSCTEASLLPVYAPQERGVTVKRTPATGYPAVVVDACDTIDKVKAATVHIYGVYDVEKDPDEQIAAEIMEGIAAGILDRILGGIGDDEDGEGEGLGEKTTLGESGTGFFINYGNNIYLITNNHVVENTLQNNGTLTVKFPPEVSDREDSIVASVLARDKINDVALLCTFMPLPKRAAALELADMETVRAGEHVVTVGCPRHMEFNAVEGSVSNPFYKDHPLEIGNVLCTLNATHGNSGGAIVRLKDNKVIGLVKSGFSGDYLPGHTVCGSADAIKQLINMYERG